MTDDRRFIEETLPIKEISEESAKEKSIRHGHISTLHIWWARRPLVASRAAIFTSLIKAPRNTKEENDFRKFIIELCKWENSNNKQLIDKARKLILENNDDKIPKVLDCFAGGGSIPLESLRLGCDTYALDLNPVAHLLELCTLVYPQKYGKPVTDKTGFVKSSNKLSYDVDKWGKWFLNTVNKEIGKFYPKDPDGSVPIVYIWSRTVKCPNPGCGTEIPLIRQYWLCNRSNKKVALKPSIKGKKIEFEVVEGKKLDFDPEEGTTKTGSALCLVCKQAIDGSYIRKESTKNLLGQRLLAIILSKPDGTKKYRVATKKDSEIFEEANQYLKKLISKYKDLVPNEKIIRPPDDLSVGDLLPFYVHLQIVNYGINKWSDIFNSRQLLTIISLAKEIRELESELKKNNIDIEQRKAIISYIALSIDRLAVYLTNLGVWVSNGEFVGQVFSQGQAIAMKWDYAEVNPFSGLTGSLEGALNWIKRVIEHCSFIEKPANVLQGSATNLPYDDKFFDRIITDPPYYDAVPYSDVSDFFYVLLKRTVGNLYPKVFSTPLTPKASEIIQNSSLVRRTDTTKENSLIKTKDFYEKEMTKAFKEMNRVIKDDGVFVVVFAHKSTAAWETLINGLLNSNWVVTGSWPIHTERPGRLRSHDSAALASSIFIVCRKRLTEEEGYFSEVKNEVKEKIHEKLDEFWAQGIRGADFFISAIGPAVEVFGKYKKVKRVTGEEVGVGELLDIVRQIVTDYSLHQILHDGQLGIIDEATRFYVLWRWAYDSNDVPFDDARKLAQALGIESDQLMGKKDLLEKKGDKVRLLGPKERAKSKDLGEPRAGLRAPMIDVIHKACILWEKNNRKALTDLIENSGYSGDIEALWNVAQAVSEILPDGDKEKQLLQGLLNTKTSLPSNKFKSQTTLESYRGQ